MPIDDWGIKTYGAKSITIAFQNLFMFSLMIQKADASAFIKTHKLGTAVLATRKIVSIFNQPPLPSIFVADRQSLMVMRRLGFDSKRLKEVDRFLDLHNSL
jgi:hypothetical protein